MYALAATVEHPRCDDRATRVRGGVGANLRLRGMARDPVVHGPANRQQRDQHQQPEQRMTLFPALRPVVRGLDVGFAVPWRCSARRHLQVVTTIVHAACGRRRPGAQRSAVNTIGTCTTPATGCPPRCAGESASASRPPPRRDPATVSGCSAPGRSNRDAVRTDVHAQQHRSGFRR